MAPKKEALPLLHYKDGDDLGKNYGFVVVKEHYTQEDIHEIQCFCFTKDKAEEEQQRIQNEIDPAHNEWKVVINPFVEIVT